MLSKDPLVPGEDPAEFAEFRDSLLSELAPIGPLEHELVDTVLHACWRLRRARQIEAGLLGTGVEQAETALNTPEGSPSVGSVTMHYYFAKDENGDLTEMVEEPPELVGVNGGRLVPAGEAPDEPEDVSISDPPTAYGRAFRIDALRTFDVFGKLGRHEAHLQRLLFRALAELRRLQDERRVIASG